MHGGLKVLAIVVVAAGLAPSEPTWGQFHDSKKYGEYFEEEKPWVEAEAALPEYPKPENLVELYVSAATSNKFLVDAKSISVGEDGIVRYAIVVKTSGGATNISFEGIRCKTKERRLYAFGRSDGTWSKARSQDWTGIRPGGYQAVLFREYFCPGGVAIFRAEEGVGALKQGGHPHAR